MKTIFRIGVAAFALTALTVACSFDDDGGDSNPTNSNPSAFNVTVSSVTESAATLTWSAASDPDGDTVSYTVILSGSEVATNLNTLTLPLSGLNLNSAYSGSVTASDGNGGSTAANFSFNTLSETSGLHAAFAEFDVDNTDIMLSGTNVLIESNGLPNHTSPYWSNTTERCTTTPQGGSICTNTNTTQNHSLFVEPTATSHSMMAPGNIDDFNGSYSLTVSASPVVSTSSTATGLGPIGIAVSGAMIYNDQEGPNVPLDDNTIGSFDYTAAHTGPQSYHYHLEPKAWSDDDEGLIGIMSDGFFIYGRKCNSTGAYPADLDASGGHTSTTQHTTDAEYHYHIKNEVYLSQYYIIFPGDYQGNASTIN